jgi:hypothetical protein
LDGLGLSGSLTLDRGWRVYQHLFAVTSAVVSRRTFNECGDRGIDGIACDLG